MSEEHKPEENLTVGKATLSEGREIKQDDDDDDDDDDKREDGQVIRRSDDEDYCRTPTSEEHKIPRAQSCPPAPRKPRVQEQVSFLRKRKLLEFYEIVKREEVESLFGSSSSSAENSRVSSSWPRKRRCRSR